MVNGKLIFKLFTTSHTPFRHSNRIRQTYAFRPSFSCKITSRLWFGLGFLQLEKRCLLLLMKASKSTIKRTIKHLRGYFASLAFGNEKWAISQDSLSEHNTRRAYEWCKQHLTGLLRTQKFPLYSPDINQMGYSA